MRIFGVGAALAQIPMDDPTLARELVDALGRVDGMLLAGWVRGDWSDGSTGDGVLLTFVDDNPRDVHARVRAIRQLPHVSKVLGPFPTNPPQLTRRLTALDWRVVAALRADPMGRLSDVARRLGITLKTLVRHRNALIDSKAIWYYAWVNWQKCPSVSLTLYYEEANQLPAIERALTARFQHYLPSSNEGLEDASPSSKNWRHLIVRVPVNSVDESHALLLELSQIEGVVRTQIETIGYARIFAEWKDRALAERLSAADAALIRVAHATPGETPGTLPRATDKRLASPIQVH